MSARLDQPNGCRRERLMEVARAAFVATDVARVGDPIEAAALAVLNAAAENPCPDCANALVIRIEDDDPHFAGRSFDCPRCCPVPSRSGDTEPEGTDAARLNTGEPT